MAQVVIMMGSKSDEEKVSPCVDVLRSLGISYLFTVSSAHRTPERTEKILREPGSRRRQGLHLRRRHGRATWPVPWPPAPPVPSSASRSPAA